jgi:hypothetical protein
MYVKCLYWGQGRVLHIKAKKIFHKITCLETSGFRILFEVQLKNKHFTYVIFHLQLIQYIYRKRFQLNNYWVIIVIKTHFTTDVQKFLHLSQYKHGHVWSWTVTHFQMDRSCLKWFKRHKNCVGDKSLY